MLATQVTLHDIDDCEAFVAATIRRADIRPASRDEHDDLILEGLAILCELAGKYEPHRPGYQQPGRFSGYAAMFLPRRLGDAWHRAHPEHRYVTDPQTGRRRWIYDAAPVSIEPYFQPDQSRRTADFGEGYISTRARRLHEFVPLPIPSGFDQDADSQLRRRYRYDGINQRAA